MSTRRLGCELGVTRFDVVAAFFLYSMFYGHDNYTRSIQYRISKLKFRDPYLGETERLYYGLTAGGWFVYLNLVRTKYSKEAYLKEIRGAGRWREEIRKQRELQVIRKI